MALSDQYKSVVKIIREELDKADTPRIIRTPIYDPHVTNIKHINDNYHGRSA